MATPNDLSLLIKNTSAAENLIKIVNDSHHYSTNQECGIQINTNDSVHLRPPPPRGYPRIKSTPTRPPILSLPPESNQEIVVPAVPPYVKAAPFPSANNISLQNEPSHTGYKSMFETLQQTTDMQSHSMLDPSSYSPPLSQSETSIPNVRYDKRPSPLACSSGPTSQVLRLSVLSGSSPNGEVTNQVPTQLKAVPVTCLGFVNVDPTLLDGRKTLRISSEFGEKLRRICTTKGSSMPDEVAQLLSSTTNHEREVKRRSPTIGSIFDKLGCEGTIDSLDEATIKGLNIYHELNSTTEDKNKYDSVNHIKIDLDAGKFDRTIKRNEQLSNIKKYSPSKTTPRKHLKLSKSFFTPTTKESELKQYPSQSHSNPDHHEEDRVRNKRKEKVLTRKKKRSLQLDDSATEDDTESSADSYRIGADIDIELLRGEKLSSPEIKPKKRKRKDSDKQSPKSLVVTPPKEVKVLPPTISPSAKVPPDTNLSPESQRNSLLNLDTAPKSYMLVPSYKGFQDFSPIVIDSRTRSRATDDEKGQLTKPEFPILVVKRTGDEEKQIIVNKSDSKVPVVIPGVPIANVEQLKGDNEKEKRRLSFNRTSGETILHKAARLGYADLAESKLKEHADVNAQDNAGWTALHEACSRGQIEVVRVLLKYGADVNVCSKSGIRPLHDAVDGNHNGVLRELMAFGANPLIATYAGVTALDFAKTEKMRSLLRGHAYDVGYLSPDEEPSVNKEIWQFRGSSTVMDHDDDDTIEVIHSAPAPQLGTGVEFIVSQKAFPSFYHLPVFKDEKLTGYVNYILLSDALERARIKRDKFLLKYKANVRIINREELIKFISNGIIKPHLPDESEGDEIELIHLGPYAMQTLFGWKFHRF